MIVVECISKDGVSLNKAIPYDRIISIEEIEPQGNCTIYWESNTANFAAQTKETLLQIIQKYQIAEANDQDDGDDSDNGE